MATTARVSNIDTTTTKEDLITHLLSKGLLLSHGERAVLFTPTEGARKVAMASFRDHDHFKRALALPAPDRMMAGNLLTIDEDFDGLTVLSDGAQVDIVALHGLNGHAFRSWEYRDTGFMWLRDHLPDEVPTARIMIYGYNANIIDDVSTGRLRTFADTFLERLRYVREKASQRPLILLAHSMGGLVIKQALLTANTRADGRFNSILNSVRGVIFVGTPHRGGNGVDGAKFVANFVRAFNVEVRYDLIKSLESGSPVLFDLTDDFRQLVAAKGIEIATLFETKKTRLGSRFLFGSSIWIVEEQSAILGVTGERKASINADHANLCKFVHAADNSLVVAVQVVKEFCRDCVPTITALDHSTQPPPPEGLKYTCLSDPDKLGDSTRYPVLILGKYEYWALSHIDNRFGMTILAYDDQKDIVGRWARTGARYVHRIEYDEENQQVKFVGQASHAITFGVPELKVTKSTRFG
ncbi:hypothetical protein EYR36_010014 [Pleurotus pulmonarius]|nr:hypothetical protein EYR36_010014 [Pleurotus pulmonarius]KAF4593491.1 hypothetical protein EYR38_009206 [Pleurotus pulmonarius]